MYVIEVQLILTELDFHKFRIFQCNLHINHKENILKIHREGKENVTQIIHYKKQQQQQQQHERSWLQRKQVKEKVVSYKNKEKIKWYM